MLVILLFNGHNIQADNSKQLGQHPTGRVLWPAAAVQVRPYRLRGNHSLLFGQPVGVLANLVQAAADDLPYVLGLTASWLF